jgi:competence protein ComEA
MPSVVRVRGTGRPGRGKRGRVADRVRALVGADLDADLGGELGTERGTANLAAAPWVPANDRAPWLPAEHIAPRAPAPGSAPRAGLLSRLRWEPDRRTAIAVGIAVLVVGALTLWWVLSARPRSLAVSSTPGPASTATGVPTLSASATATTSGPAPSTRLVIDVAGKVRHPGVYRLVNGARVVDALRAAGGALPGVSTISLNLAEPLRDGQQVVVGVPGTGAGAAGVAPAGASATAAGGAAGLVNLNAATVDQLQTLPGVGPVLAQHILDWRTQHGHFDTVDQLNEVSGIGEVKFGELRALVTV